MKHSNPFVAGPMLQNPQLFVGREEELRAIISRMRGSQPTSLNIVGERQIGKSSLLYYFFLTWQQRISQPEKYVVIYLSLKNANCQKEKNFYQAIAQKLLNCPSVKKESKLIGLLQKKTLNRLAFTQAIEEFKQQSLLPVLCLDDFDSLFDHRNEHQKEFDNGFYDNLRALMDDSALMLVLTTCKELDVYGKEYHFVSSFFNVGHVIKLGEFTKDEAKYLTNLSVNSIEETPALTEEEQKLAKKWGKCHPYLLQLAAYYLWEARQNGRDFKWAEKEFKSQLNKDKYKLNGHSRPKISWLLIITLIIIIIGIISVMIIMPQSILMIFNSFGAIGQTLDTIENLSHIIIGLLILVIVILSATRLLPEVKEFLLHLLKKFS